MQKAFWTKLTNFGQFLAKMTKMVKIMKNALGKFFPTFWVLTIRKVPEKKVMNGIRESAVRANGKTHGQTHRQWRVNPKVQWRREQKPVVLYNANVNIKMCAIRDNILL